MELSQIIPHNRSHGIRQWQAVNSSWDHRIHQHGPRFHWRQGQPGTGGSRPGWYPREIQYRILRFWTETKRWRMAVPYQTRIPQNSNADQWWKKKKKKKMKRLNGCTWNTGHHRLQTTDHQKRDQSPSGELWLCCSETLEKDLIIISGRNEHGWKTAHLFHIQIFHGLFRNQQSGRTAKDQRSIDGGNGESHHHQRRRWGCFEGTEETIEQPSSQKNSCWEYFRRIGENKKVIFNRNITDHYKGIFSICLFYFKYLPMPENFQPTTHRYRIGIRNTCLHLSCWKDRRTIQ